MQNSGSPQLDLSGKLIIKVALGDDIRRIPIHNEDITYDELVLMMQRVYRGKLSTNDEITIKYKDEDNDLITIFDSSDLTFAIQCSRILKITLFVGGPTKSVLEPASTVVLRRELQDIRDRVIDLLDRLEPTSLVSVQQSLGIGDGLTAGKGPLPAARPVNALGGKEFDPLTAHKGQSDLTQNKVASSFGIDGNVNTSSQYDRAATPDSVSSIGSSASNQVRAQQNTYQPQSNIANQQQQQQQPQAPQQQQQPPQQQQQVSYGGQPGYNQGQPGPMPQSYAGQPGYGIPQPGLPQQPQLPQQQQQQQQQPQLPVQQQQYDPALYNQYAAGYPAGQPGQGLPGQGQGQMMYSQAGSPVTGPYNQAPGMPQQPQAKNPGYPTAPAAGQGGAQTNPYSRGYSAGYPRPNAGYPQ
ncbi:unnamed protein product [Lymnaea stagnalis]|uniref:PB1 domain-containing protein n=1 Tax=Lymnaea stagnalis TaxID=6523 RepID=A0AAV2I0U9_LYMST